MAEDLGGRKELLISAIKVMCLNLFCFQENKKTQFNSTGVDFADPLYVSDDNGKYYICLFSCFITRAVHLELTASLSVEDFILACRKFTAKRGLPELLMSDNAKTFVSASCRSETMYGDRRQSGHS